MEQKKCKKCQRTLSEGYKHKRCEKCRNEQIQHIKEFGKATLSLAVIAGGAAVTIITRGKINPNEK